MDDIMILLNMLGYRINYKKIEEHVGYKKYTFSIDVYRKVFRMTNIHDSIYDDQHSYALQLVNQIGPYSYKNYRTAEELYENLKQEVL